MTENTLKHILLVEDNAVDIMMCQTAFSEAVVPVTVHVVKDGELASKFLQQKEPYSQSPRPNLVLLDLNLPGKSGYELLREMKSDTSLLAIPVIVLTSSEAERDIIAAYHLHANCYLTKPVGYDDLKRLVDQVLAFWLSVAKLPENSG